jgi:Predicted ribosomal protein
MVNVIFNKKDRELVSIKMVGHAESVGEGYDLVCCAISTVSQTILIGILEVLKLKITYSLDDGLLNFSLENLPDEDIKKCQVLMETMLLGLKSIEIGYGEYIKIEVEEV